MQFGFPPILLLFFLFLLLISTSSLSTAEGTETTVTPVRNESVALGDRALLSCQINNRGSKTVSWKRLSENHPLTIGESIFTMDYRLSIHINQRTGLWTLMIQDVKLSDEGVYVCLVTTKDNDSNGSAKVHLTIKTIQLTGTSYLERFGSLRLVCNISGRPNLPTQVTWLHDNHVITSDSFVGITIRNRVVDGRYLVSEYVKRRAEMSDEGKYQCRSNNNQVATIDVNIINDFLILASPKLEMPLPAKTSVLTLNSASHLVTPPPPSALLPSFTLLFFLLLLLLPSF